ncbi:MAG TPA: ATP synthase F1 subunit delta [Ignavibacteriaceae bacterium]|nr:ATP synthase F1 subunit delta [Ignavibacteriaceae bacterium]
MVDNKVSLRYASSLMQLAMEKKNLDILSRDLERIHSDLVSHHQLLLALQNPIIKSEVKLSILKEVWKDKVSNDTISFLELIVQKGRENLLQDIAAKFIELTNKHLGIVLVEVTAAGEFTPEQDKEIKSKLKSLLNKEVKVKYKIDDSIIGGFQARVGDTVYDATIKHQLEQLRKRFLEGNTLINN